MRWAPTGEVFARSSLSARFDYQVGLTSSGPVPLEQPPHTEPDTEVPERRFLLSQMVQTSHMQPQASETKTHVLVNQRQHYIDTQKKTNTIISWYSINCDPFILTGLMSRICRPPYVQTFF